MRKVHVAKITAAVKRICIDTNYKVDPGIMAAFKRGLKTEKSPVGVEILRQLIRNAEIAAKERIPICQDCGLAVVFVELGGDVQLTGGGLRQAIEEGVRQGYREGYLRKSVVKDPMIRVNTGDNTPAIIHVDIVPGSKIKITVAPKGGGSENMSRLKMMKPADGEAGVKDLVRETVREAGPNPCPPIVLGVGIGGNFEMCAILAKKALLRKLGVPNRDKRLARLEKELLKIANDSGVGPQGAGGTVTCLGVAVESRPCHIASMPVAVNVNCHVSRHGSTVI